jgi:hypothetical protein
MLKFVDALRLSGSRDSFYNIKQQAINFHSQMTGETILRDKTAQKRGKHAQLDIST